MADDGVVKEGFLVKAPDNSKYLHVFKKWQRRYFQLDKQGNLCLYENEKTPKPSGVFHVYECSRMFDGKTKAIQLSYLIGLELFGGNIYLKAESAKHFNEWIVALGEFIDNCEISKAPDDSRERGSVHIGQDGDLRERHGSVLSVKSRHLSFNTKARFLTKEGWLSKTGGNNTGWRDRYFKLFNGKLSYFKSEKADSPKGAIDLFECTSVHLAEGKRGFCFDIEVPGRVFNLKAENDALRTDWIAVINHTLEQIADIKSSAPATRSGRSVTPEMTLVSSVEESTEITGEDDSQAELHHYGRDASSAGSTCSVGQSIGEEHKDSVMQLLEAEVEALRTKVSNLETELKSSTSINRHVQQQLEEVKASQANNEQRLKEDKEHLLTQIEQLMKSKREVETVNDSVVAQLDEQQARRLELEEEIIGLRQEIEESQNNVSALEEELADTHHKLHEIENDARKLKKALEEKAGSEPPTPIDVKSIGDITRLYQAKLESSVISVENEEESQLVEEIKQELSTLKNERDQLKKKLDSINSVQVTSDAASNDGMTEPHHDVNVDVSVNEERLKWQMEMENLRKGFETEMDTVKKSSAIEKAELRKSIKCSTFDESSRQQISVLEKKLSESMESTQHLQSEVKSYQERVSQLLVEKEKALSDLIAIRKINRNMEKRMSDSEDVRVASPRLSVSNDSPLLESPDSLQKLLETEKKFEELKGVLNEVESERDYLKAQLEQLTGNQTMNKQDANSNDLIGFRFQSKTCASTALSGSSTYPREGAFPTVVASQDNEASISGNNPPPKPKRPPKELLDHYTSSTQPKQMPVSRSRAATVLNSLFGK